METDDLCFLRGGGLLELVAEGAAAIVEAGEGLVEGGRLVDGSGEAGGGVDAKDDVVEGFYIAVDGEDFGGCGGGVEGG